MTNTGVATPARVMPVSARSVNRPRRQAESTPVPTPSSSHSTMPPMTREQADGQLVQDDLGDLLVALVRQSEAGRRAVLHGGAGGVVVAYDDALEEVPVAQVQRVVEPELLGDLVRPVPASSAGRR
ncbi:hypothetical protein SGRIM128S_09049 [Streptomyces griseomycini]